MMRKLCPIVLVLGLLVFLSTTAVQAASITLEPGAQSVVVGTPVDVAVRISGLPGPGAAPSLSTFDLDISFDPGFVLFDSAVFGDPVLGDQLDLFGFGSITAATPGAGIVNLFELSFDLPGDLVALQEPSFILATLTFNTIAVGTSPVGVAINALGDELGNDVALTLGPTTVTG